MRTFILICLMVLSTSSFAQTPPSAQTTPSQATPSAQEVERRAREVGNALRCVVCQNQSIEESEASLAKDMHVIVRERIAAGESDAQVIEFMRERYGDYVLLKPPLQRNTVLLWFLPALIIVLMVLWFFKRVNQARPEASQPEALSDEERNTLKRLMDERS